MLLSRPGARSAPLLLNPYICTRCLRRAAAASVTRKSSAAAIAAVELSNASSSTKTNTPRRLRYYSTTTTNSTTTPPTPSSTSANDDSGIAPLPHRRLLSLSGPDAPKFLQGLTTNNVLASSPTGWYTAFLNAQGRVLHDAFVYPTRHAVGGDGGEDEWACFIEVDASSLDGLAAVLKRHKLRSKVRIARVDEGEWRVWAAWGSAAPPAASSGDTIVLEDTRASGLGWRIVARGGEEAPVEGVPVRTEREYRVRRYVRGVAEGPGEVRAGEALPLESNVDLMGGVDFRKGCYVGQELTIRTKHTGVVRKRVLPVRLYGVGEEEPGEMGFVEGEVNGVRAEEIPGGVVDVKRVAEGAEEEGAGRKRSAGRSAGKWLAGVGNVGLALCRLEMMTDVKVAAEGIGAGGYKPGMRFGLKWTVEGEEGEKSVGIKAFVPEWHHLRAEEEAKGRKKKQPPAADES